VPVQVQLFFPSFGISSADAGVLPGEYGAEEKKEDGYNTARTEHKSLISYFTVLLAQ
jgi:hypothetical protein